MPHKKNPIICEKVGGMFRMAKGYLLMTTDNVPTWEERAIEQSSVERVAWPDLFHVTAHALTCMTKVLSGLVVYPDNMLLEIEECRGTYASAGAKEFLKKHGLAHGISSDDAYRIVQLASFNAFVSRGERAELADLVPNSLKSMDQKLGWFLGSQRQGIVCIRELILEGNLFVSEQLGADEATVQRWNKALQAMFVNNDELEGGFRKEFFPSKLLAGEAVLYKEILGV